MGRRDLGVAVAGAFALVGLQAGPSAADPVVTDTIGVGDGPFSVAVSPDGTRAYIANVGSDTVSVIDTTTNPPAVQGTPIAVGDGANGVAVSPDGTRAYVTNYLSNTVSVLALQPSPPTGVSASATRRRTSPGPCPRSPAASRSRPTPPPHRRAGRPAPPAGRQPAPSRG